MEKQTRYTKNVEVLMFLAECEHEARLMVQGTQALYFYCLACNKNIPAKPVGTILVSLDKDGFLTVLEPLKVR